MITTLRQVCLSTAGFQLNSTRRSLLPGMFRIFCVGGTRTQFPLSPMPGGLVTRSETYASAQFSGPVFRIRAKTLLSRLTQGRSPLRTGLDVSLGSWEEYTSKPFFLLSIQTSTDSQVSSLQGVIVMSNLPSGSLSIGWFHSTWTR